MRLAAERTATKDADDLQLAARAAHGDTDAFTAIMRRHNRMLYRAARSILRSDAEAEDAVQDAYVRAYRAMNEFRGDASLSTWLTRIAVNEALGRLRKRRREGNVVAFDEALSSEGELSAASAPDRNVEGPDAAASREQTRALLERHIDALPVVFRTVFVLRALEEMSVDEAAACLDIPAATVRTRYFRARALLRESLERELDLASTDAFGFAGQRCNRIVAAVLGQLRSAPPDASSG
jgi:RNA polymerase sigma-70 factor (ECF subfamily)